MEFIRTLRCMFLQPSLMQYYPGLEKIRTKQILYQDVMSAADVATLEELRELSCRRKAIEDYIGQNSHVTDAIAREVSGGITSRCQQGIQRVEGYLPMLENLIDNVTNHNHPKMSLWVSDLKIRWSAWSSIFRLPCTKFYQVNDLHFEMAMILYLYGATLRERAMEVCSSDRVQSAMLQRKAAGVYDFLAIVALTHFDSFREKPPEISHRISSLMSLICLAEAQVCSGSQAIQTRKSHGLVAKLYFGGAEFLLECIEVMQVITREWRDISPGLLEYFETCKAHNELIGWMYFVHSLQDDAETGVKIGILQKAIANAKKRLPIQESRKSVFQQQIDIVSRILKKYKRENELIWHEKIPPAHDLPLPQAVKVVTAIPYRPVKTKRTLAFKMS